MTSKYKCFGKRGEKSWRAGALGLATPALSPDSRAAHARLGRGPTSCARGKMASPPLGPAALPLAPRDDVVLSRALGYRGLAGAIHVIR